MRMKLHPKNQDAQAVELKQEFQEKVCSRCKKLLPRSAFFARAKSPDGLQSICKSCKATMKAESRAAEKKAPVAPAAPVQAPATQPPITAPCARCEKAAFRMVPENYYFPDRDLIPLCKECHQQWIFQVNMIFRSFLQHSPKALKEKERHQSQ